MAIKVHVDTIRCAASGQCAMALPAVFDQREADGVVMLINEHPDPALHDAVRRAAEICPSGAIRVEEI